MTPTCTSSSEQSCREEAFLHVAMGFNVDGTLNTYLTCTKHTRESLMAFPPLVLDGVRLVHEADDMCGVAGSVWDFEQNCCVVPEDSQVGQEAEEAALLEGVRRLTKVAA